jgi:hypothetical protein
VKAILAMSLWAQRAAPTSPYPVRTYKTPGGNPASTANCPMNKAVNGVDSAGFKMEQHPVARAGAHFHDYIKSGKFHGIICPTIPTGSFLV